MSVIDYRKSANFFVIIALAGIFHLSAAAREITSPENLNVQTTASEEDIVITGRVTDEAGNAISGVTVKIRNSTRVSRTDVAGVFELDGVPLKSVVLIDHPKYITRQIKMNKPKPYYRIVLKRK